MSASPASLMRRIYYVTIILALIVGGAYFVHSYRIGQASDTTAAGNVVGSQGKIAIPTDWPNDLPIYRGGLEPTVTTYGFSYRNGRKYHTLLYSLITVGNKKPSYSDALAYYLKEFSTKKWTYTENKTQVETAKGTYLPHENIYVERPDGRLDMAISQEEYGITIIMQEWPKDSSSVATISTTGSGAVLPASFPSDLPVHPKASLIKYDLYPGMGKPGIYPQAEWILPVSTGSMSEVMEFYSKEAARLGWETRKDPQVEAMRKYLTNGNVNAGGEMYAFAVMSQNALTFKKNGNILNILILDSKQLGTKGSDSLYVSLSTRPLEEYDEYPSNSNVNKFSLPPKSSARPSNVPKQQPSDEDRFEPLNLPDFEDLPNGYGYAPAINGLRAKGVLRGYPDGTFKPGNPVNRAEFVKTIVEALGDEASGKSCFSDVKEEWFSQYVCYAKEHDIIGGYPDGSFGPERNVNYAEAVKIVMLAFGKMEESDEEGWEWYDKYFNAAKERGYLELIESIAEDDPNTPISRGQMAQLIANVAGQ